MTVFEIVLVILVCITPIVALLFVLPKRKKKEVKPKETTSYVTLEKEQAQAQAEQGTPSQVAETKPEPKKFKDDELENYRDYLNKRHEMSSRPQRHEIPKDFIDRTSAYVPMSSMRNRRTNSSNTDINNLSPEVKALLIAGILDRKF